MPDFIVSLNRFFVFTGLQANLIRQQRALATADEAHAAQQANLIMQQGAVGVPIPPITEGDKIYLSLCVNFLIIILNTTFAVPAAPINAVPDVANVDLQHPALAHPGNDVVSPKLKIVFVSREKCF